MKGVKGNIEGDSLLTYSLKNGERYAAVDIYPAKISLFLFYVAVGLGIINLAGLFLDKILGWNSFVTHALIYFFDVSQENNIPTLFSSLILFIASMLLLFIGLLPDACRGARNKK